MANQVVPVSPRPPIPVSSEGGGQMAHPMITASPFRRFAESQKVWYDQALTRTGVEQWRR